LMRVVLRLEEVGLRLEEDGLWELTMPPRPVARR
jgi:hypothetical protein